MTILRSSIRLAALMAVAAGALPASGQDVFWDTVGTSNYNTDTNWSTDIVPDAAFNERSVINSGATAFLSAVTTTPTGGVTLGQTAADSGTLEIRSGGILNSQVGTAPAGTPPDGSVIVGLSGTGTFRVLPGGTLNATALISGGNPASSIVLGGSSGSPATVNLSGVFSVSRATRVRRTAAITAGSFSLQEDSNYIVEISNLGHSMPTVAGTTTLNGRLSVEFSGVTPTVGSSFNLFNSGLVTGSFDAIQVTPNTSLSLGQKWAVTGVPAGGGRQFAQLKLDEFLVLNVNRGTGVVTIANPGSQSKSIDTYSILSASGSLRPLTWSSLDDQNALGGDWGEANPTANHLSELKFSGSSTFVAGASQSLGVANSFNPVAFGTDTNDIAFEYTKGDGTLVNGIVNYIGDPNNLLLTVDPSTGAAQLKNTSPFTVAIDSYTIRSANGSLSTTGWQSLDDQNIAGGNWGEANPTANRLSELKPTGATTLTPGTAFSLGTLFTTTGTPDLTLEFLFNGETTARTGIVAYGAISAGVPGDYNGNGRVDAADYVAWRDGGTLLNDPTPGVQPADYSFWRSRFGATSGSGAGATAVPEPAALLLAAMLGVTLGACRLRLCQT